jgi:hypothetical protein
VAGRGPLRDSNGYQVDHERFMWRWRDWVIEAFNKNMPFDRFIVEQLAGDLTESDARSEDRDRVQSQSPTNAEGGITSTVTSPNTWRTAWRRLRRCFSADAGMCPMSRSQRDPFTQKVLSAVRAFQ